METQARRESTVRQSAAYAFSVYLYLRDLPTVRSLGHPLILHCGKRLEVILPSGGNTTLGSSIAPSPTTPASDIADGLPRHHG